MSVRAALLLSMAFALGCGPTTGTWGEVAFAPDRGALALADRHDLVSRAGAVSAVLKPESSRTFSLLLSGVALDVGREWRRLPILELQQLRRDLATRDNALVLGLPLDEIEAGSIIPLDESTLLVGVAQPAPDLELGALRGSLIVEEALIEPLGGRVAGVLELEREGGEASGQVEVRFDVELARERLAKANLAVAAPVLRCVSERGNAASAGCAEAEADEILDASASVR